MDQIVEIKNGKLRGEVRNNIVLFKGIPYGDVCDGEWRFLPPRPVKNWEGVKDCTKNGYYAVQPWGGVNKMEYFNGGHPEKFGASEEQQSENCLCLNVVAPRNSNKKHAVVVYFHGGGFGGGNGSIVLGADRLVEGQDIVVVGVNHRLSVFGYLYLEQIFSKYEGSGVAGILDLVLALKWVKNNIGVFGGDPDQVTIMGESGGAAKVRCLLSMPEAKGLFKRAIIESGSVNFLKSSVESGEAGFMRDPIDATKTARKILKDLNIDENHPEKLQEISKEEFMKVALPYMMELSPVIDGNYLKYGNEKGFVTNEYDRSVELLIGCSEDECAIDWKDICMENQTLEEALLNSENLSPMIPVGWNDNKERMKRIIKYAGEHNPKHDDDEHLFWKVSSVVPFFCVGVQQHILERLDENCAPTFVYLNRFDAPSNVNEQHRYSWHTFDLPLQFGIVRYPCCEQISLQMMEAWGNFIKTGNPSTEKLPWKPYNLKEKKVMVFDDESGMETDPMSGWYQAYNG